MSSYVFQHGKGISTVDAKLTNNKPCFRKMINKMEYRVYKLMMKNPHKNIVTVYDITREYVDLEILDLNFKVAEIDLDILRGVQKYLWEMNILTQKFEMSTENNIEENIEVIRKVHLFYII